ncbi:MAG TPA: TauD/TfdA family dioxygenase [Acidimicrobiia bacterium]|nr:TauD/TfdA family dioxygenase [Acidimicrobiia bacterium]
MRDTIARGGTALPTGLSVRPLTAAIGAEVSGIDLRDPLDDVTVAAIRGLLLEHLVLFFRDQHIDDEQHLAFAQAFGPLSISPVATRYQDSPKVTVLDQVSPKGEGADEWHSDNTFMAKPPMASILRAAQLPEVGGDTCFASMYAAYDALSPALRSLVDGLRAVHDITKPMRKAIAAGHSTLDLAETQRRWPPVEHPVAATHPETGRKALFVNRNSTTHIVGLTERENDVLLPFLLDHVRSPDFQCRFHWEVGSIAFWDNRSVQHFAVADYTQRRVMRRVTIDGPGIT